MQESTHIDNWFSVKKKNKKKLTSVNNPKLQI